MAQTENSSTTPIGKVLIVYGDVKAVNEAGMERVLTPNSPIFENERLVTGPDGMVTVLFDDGQTQLDLGKMSDIHLDADVYSRLDSTEMDNTIADINQIQQALEEGNFDPTTQLEPTAAGPAAAGNTPADGGGRETVEFTPEGLAVTPDSGAETIGLTRDFLDPPTIIIREEEGTQPAPTPVAAPAAAPAAPGIPVTPETPETPDIPPPEIPPPGPEPTPMTDPDEILTVSEIAPLMGTEPQQISGNFLDNVENAVTPVITSITVQDANGVDQVVALVPGVSKTVDIYQDTLKTGTLTVSSDGSYTYTLDTRADHGLPEQYGAADDISLVVNYLVTDTTTGATDSSKLTIIIEDGEPVVSVDQDAIIANEGGNCVTGEITAQYGADGQATLVSAMQLLDKNGNSLISTDPVNNPIFVTDTNGRPLTSGGDKLMYVDNGAGGVNAVIYDGTANGGATVFTVKLTPPTAGNSDASYTVILDKTTLLDNHFETTTTEESISLKNLTVNSEGKAEGASSDGQVHILVSEKNSDGSDAPITSDNDGIGVNEAGSYHQSLSIDFTTNTGSTTTMDSVSFSVNGLDQKWGGLVMERLTWSAYDANGNAIQNADGTTLENITLMGTPDGHATVTIDADAVARISVTGMKSNFSIDAVSGKHSTVSDDTQSVQYTVKITDDDQVNGQSTGDTDTSGVFTVTFDADGNITGTDRAETISGSSGDDTISGGGGNDTIYAHSGDDTISGGDGDDQISGGAGDDTITGDAGNDTLAGGEGSDKITGGAGADTVAQSEVDSGEVTDMDATTDSAVADDSSDISSLINDPTCTG